jgi:hypothetical protein
MNTSTNFNADQSGRPGPRPTPLLHPHSALLRGVALWGLCHGISRRRIQQAAGGCSDVGFTRILRGQAHKTDKSLAVAGLVGHMLGIRSDSIVVGLTLPQPDPELTLAALIRLLRLSKGAQARDAVQKRISEIERQLRPEPDQPQPAAERASTTALTQ